MVTSVSNATTASTSSTSTSTTDAITARVESVLQSQKAGVTKLNNALTADQTKLSGLGQLQSALATFQSVATALGGSGLSTAATPTPSGKLTATTDSSAVAGTHDVVVQQLAQGQVLNAAAQTSSSTALGTGAATTITIDYGTASGGTFTAGDKASSKTITIDSSNNTLDGIAAALKTAGVNATVVKSADGYALSITGPDGAASSMRVSVSGDATLNKLLGYDPAGTQNLTQSAAAQDATLTVDGKQVTSASNTVTGALAGVTLKLTATGTTSLAVAQNSSQIASNVASFVSAYNTLNTTLQSLSKGALKSDSALNQVTSQLAQILKTGGGSPAALAKAGVTMDQSGNLKLDNTKLTAAIAADPATMGKLFTNGGKGVADLMSTQIASLTGTSGRIAKEVTSTTADLNTVTAKKATLATALTAQATALAALYSQADSSALGMFSSASSTTPSSLFDLMA